MRQEGIEGIELFTQVTFDVIDRVNQPRGHLDLPAADHADAARLADARFVVAIDIRAHGQFRLVLAGIEEPQDLRRVADRVTTARDGTGDGASLNAVAVNPDVHFWRSADQVLSLTEVYQKPVRRGISLAQATE